MNPVPSSPSSAMPFGANPAVRGSSVEHVPGAATDASGARPLVSRGRTMLVHASLVLFAFAILARAVQVQLVDRERWARVALEQHVRRLDVTPPRGRILDATGSVLVESRELVRIGVTPKALDSTKRYGDGRAVLRRELKALGVRAPLVQKAQDTTLKWVAIPGLFVPSDVEKLSQLRAVTRERQLRRFVSAPIGIKRIIGAVNDEQVAQSGLELELDHVLRGVNGRDELLKDGRGNRLESPALARISATPGHTITLSLNRSLQEIIERELAEAMARTGASGGDVVMLDPRDGSVLALAGARDGQPSANSTPLTEPYEPGSVVKPFIVARLLDDKRARIDEIVNTESGTWLVAGRTITDEHKSDQMSVADVIRLSSNIGVAKLAQRLSAREEFETLRDFGFGTLTGVPYPKESRGRLPVPGGKAGWSAQTPASLAMGYELSATPLQLATAYAAIANGGELLQPVLVREIHDANGTLLYKHQRRVLRRALSEETSLTMRTMLRSVVDSGTAVAAGLETYDVAGKSGTARRTVGKGYASGAYNATFAAMFPAQAPQYVIIAKLIDPKSKIFGGVVAGELVNHILQAANATRDASLDRRELARYAKVPQAPVEKPLTSQALAAAARDSARFDSLRAPTPAPAAPVAAAGRVVVVLPFSAPPTARADAPTLSQFVPSVYGLDVRQAARTLYAAGFQVLVQVNKGTAGQTRPATGAVARAGSTVVLFTAP